MLGSIKAMKRIIRWMMPVLTLISVFMLSACGEDMGAYDYRLSYINKDTTTLVDVGYNPVGSDTASVVDEFFDKLSTDTNEVDYYSPISGDVVVENYFLENGRLKVTFSEEYLQLDSVRDVLTRCAIVRSMTQIKGIDSVEFFVGEESARDSKGNVIGAMKENDIIMNPGEQINGISEFELTLYFADSTGKALVRETRDVYASANVSVEKLIVEQLIEGPADAKLQATIPEGTSIVNVSFLDGVCFVNLNEVFLNQNYDIDESVVVYSIVNSLTELDEVEYVQISVNGDTSGVYRDSLSLDTLFEKNPELVKQ